MSWIDDSGAEPVRGGLAKAGYRKLGGWAFRKNDKWREIVTAAPQDRLTRMARRIEEAFEGEQPNGHPHVSPRVIIEYDDGPAAYDAATVLAYHAGHRVEILVEGSVTRLYFEEDPMSITPGSYMDEYATDEDGNFKPGRSKRMFAMMLMTRCR